MTDAQFDTLVGLLGEIRDALAYLCAPEPEPEAEDGPTPCAHPEERRIDFSTPGRVHWSCMDCGHIEQGTPAPAQTPGADAKES